MQNLGNSISKIPTSYPVKVHFAGFESDTFRLQRAGWQISMENYAEFARDGYVTRLAMKHEQARLYAVTNQLSLDRRFLAAAAFGNAQELIDFYKHIEFNVICVAPNIQFQVMPMTYAPSFTAVDCTPQWIESKDIDLEKIGMFRPLALDDSAEIYVPEQSVSELLEMIKSKQVPMQKEIREKRRREKMREDVAAKMLEDDFDGYMPQRDIKAQILSIAV